MMADSPYCCEAGAAEPMAGTADAVDVWLLLEYRPTWRARALEDNELATSVRDWLAAAQARLADGGRRARLQFIRQPENDRGGITFVVADSAGCRRHDVASYASLAGVDLAGDGEPVTSPLYFVCTNAARDRCCGRFGLPLYAALRERVGDRVWQTTHVGGHRFAPNVLVLPSGRLYGRVRPADLDGFTDTVERSALGARWLRGTSFAAAAVQAAEAFLGERDDVPRCGVRTESIRPDRVRVTFADGASVDVELGAPTPSLASCGDVAMKEVRSFRRAAGRSPVT
jgi:hypothetical protein